MPIDAQVLEAIVLGTVQGLTEFLPISSSAHLLLLPWLLRWQDPGLAFDVALHVGTLLAVVIYFSKEWLDLGLSLVGRGNPENRRLLLALAVGTVPGALAGYLGEKWVNEIFHASSAQWVVGTVMAVVGVGLYISDLVGMKARPLTNLRLPDALLIGVAQATAIVPGVSRSGATMTAGLLVGLKREAAARFSFLLAAPIIAGAGLKAAVDLLHAGSSVPWAAIAAGTATACIVGTAAIALLLKWLQSRSLLPFAVYRVVVGGGVIALYLLGNH